eukprot:2902946-Pleurochrysis_carterae.AAC.1
MDVRRKCREPRRRRLPDPPSRPWLGRGGRRRRGSPPVHDFAEAVPLVNSSTSRRVANVVVGRVRGP